MIERTEPQRDDRPLGDAVESAEGVQQILDRLRMCGDRYKQEIFRSQSADSEVRRETPVPFPAPTPREGGGRGATGNCGAAEPQSIGRFQIVRRLGQGGHGLVFLAYDPRLKRPIALKIPRPEALMTSELRTRFLREAEAAAALNHPNLVPVFETGSDGAVCYIASAYVKGVSLAEWLSHGDPKTTPRDAAQLLATLADAMQHAHSRGVLHRDLKPANILLAGASDHASQARQVLSDYIPQITDFGLAKVEDVEASLTGSGSILGTPAYMSPEQSVGGSTKIGPAADIYSLGAILYELLAGRPPFQADSLLDTLQAVRHQDPSPLHREDAPTDLESICLKCLEKQPDRRYNSAAALFDDLQQFLSGHPVQARPITSVQRLGRWVARNPVVTGISAAALLLLVALSVVSTVGYVKTARALKERSVALEAVELHRGEALRRFELAQDVVGEFLVQTTSDARLKSQPLEPLRRSMLERAREYYNQLLSESPDDPQLREHSGLASWRLGNIYRLLGNFEESSAAFDTSIEILQELVEERPADLELRDHLGRGYLDYGLMFDVQRDPQRSAPLWESACDIYEQIEASARQLPEGKLHEKIMQNAGTAYTYAGRNRLGRKADDSAESYHQRALAIRRGLVEQYPNTSDNHLLLAHSHTNLGILNTEIGRFDLAGPHYEKAVGILEHLVEIPPDSPRYIGRLAKDRHLLYLHYSRNGELESAAEVLQAAIDGLENLCRRHPDLPEYMLELAKCHYNMAVSQKRREVAGAPESLARTRELIDQIRKRDYPISWPLLRALYMSDGRDDFVAGDYGSAIVDYEAALEVCRQYLLTNPDDPYAKLGLADVSLNLGRSAQRQADFEAAMEYYREGVDVISAMLSTSGEWHQAKQQLGAILVARAAILERLSRTDEAFADRMRAAELGYTFRHEELLFELTRNIAQSPVDSQSYWKRGRRYYNLGEFEMAIADCSHAIELQPDSFHPYWWRARASMMLLDFSQSSADWERVIELNPQDSGAFLYLAWIYANGPQALRNPARALELAEAEVLVGRSRANEILALARIRSGLLEGALSLLTESDRMITGDFLLSLVHIHRNDPEEARRHFGNGQAKLQSKEWSDDFWDYCLESLRDETASLLGCEVPNQLESPNS